MWTDGQGNFVAGDCPLGWRAPTDAEIAAYNAGRLAIYAFGAMQAFLANGQTFNVAATGPAVNILCDGRETTIGVLAAFALFGQAYPSGTKSWRDNKGVTTVLTAAQCIALATLAPTWADNVYAALSTVESEIAAGAITTEAQIDSYAWPAS